ncbi:hypothetical protein J40TS1_41090 [Paenibacillus montaniterrae]|uniref:LamG-like jellyroll fold domain-containing protein n=2 Tax=Paenibacillus montaniterrae TaxID=429341 RepID=A0A919YPV9_9BACL|nr:hypothetical protein J40TS1_41090 [Paenibacillus montaniterrae]
MGENIIYCSKRFMWLMMVIFVSALCWFVLPQSVLAYDLANDTFRLSTGNHGEITKLEIVGDQFPTNYVMNGSNAPPQNTSEHQWVGELMFTYRLNNGAWQEAWTSKSAGARTQSQSGNTVNITYQNSSNSQGIRNFRVDQSYQLQADHLRWEIKVTNTSNQSLEIGDFGLPLPFNEYWSYGGNEEIYETRVVTHSNVANSNSYITVQRPSGIGHSLLMVPDTATGAGFEYMDNWRIEEHPGSTWAADQGGWPEGLTVYYIHSNVIKSTNRGYLNNTSLILAPGQSKTYAFKLFAEEDEQAVKDRLYEEGLIDVTVIPSMVVPTDQKAKFALRTKKPITSVNAQYPSQTVITSLGTKPGGYHLYELQLGRLGQNDITVLYGNGEKTVLQFYAIEPIADALQRHATFIVEKTQWHMPGNIRDKVFDDWMMSTKSKRNSFSGYWGWGDDWGLTHGQFLAEKNVQDPVAAEIVAVDQYLETAIWTNLMNGHHQDYLIHDFLMPEPNDTPTYRGYAYPHVYNTYFSMYKIADLYPQLVNYIHPKETYLLRAYRIFKALYEGPVAYNWNTGLMGEMTTPDIIKALQEEGYTAEANDMIAKMTTKYNNFKNTKYPYGSEYNYDNTGEEAVYTLAKMNNNLQMMSKINTKARAVRGHMPLWYFYSVPVTITGEPWWNFQYTVALQGYAMDDWVRHHSTNPELEMRLTYASKIGNITAINSGQISSDPENIGAVAWTYQMTKGNHGALGLGGGPLFNGWRGMSGEADLGLWGAIKILSADIVVDPLFGLYGYGADVTESGSNYVIVPKDGVFQKLNLITEKLGIELERDTYTTATVAKAKNYVKLALSNATPGAAHTTKIMFTGLVSGSYNVLLDGQPVGSVNAVNGQTTEVLVNIGANQSYELELEQGTSVPIPEQVIHLEMNHTSGTTATDSSGSGNHAALHGGASWTTGYAGQALQLNGTNGYASLPAGVVNQLNHFTIASWVKVDSHADWARIFDFGSGSTHYMFLTADAGGAAGLRFAISTNGNSSEQQLSTNTPLETGKWVHVAVTKQGTTGIMYVNGVEVARNTSMTLSPSSLGATTQNYIGRSQFASDPYFKGAIDDFRIYSRALASSEIAGLANIASDIAPLATATASYVSPWESLTGLNDGYTPTSSSDRGHPVYGNWNNPNTTQWVQYTWSQPYTIDKVDVYWFDDGGGIDLPASYTIQYWNGSAWTSVSNAEGYGLLADQYNTTSFAPVTTDRIRLSVTAKATASTGIQSWKVYGN